MLKKKIAAELSITLIIVAVLGLIALVIMMAIFSKETGRTVSALDSCESRGGNCVDDYPSNCRDGTKIPKICESEYDGYNGEEIRKVCCVRIR